MNGTMKGVHEPEAELLSAEDVVRDAQRLRVFFQQRQRAEPLVAVHLPLGVLLEAIDALEADALRQVSRRVGQRLEAAQRGM